MFFSQMVNLGGLPFRPSLYPALDDYGVTPEEAQRALAGVSREIDAEIKAGRVVEFKGKLP
jgi:hypothetical protein